MIKVLLLIFEPAATWEGILRDRRSPLFIVAAYLSPLLLLASATVGYGLVHWGKWQGQIGRLKKFSLQEAVVVEAAQFLLGLLIVFAGASLLKSLGESVRGRNTYAQAFATMAYSMGPLFLLRMLDAISGISPWVSWAVGVFLSLSVLYHGVPRMMAPDPSRAFGLFFMSAVVLLGLSGLVRFVTAAYLQGKFLKLQVIVSDLAARLPF